MKQSLGYTPGGLVFSGVRKLLVLEVDVNWSDVRVVVQGVREASEAGPSEQCAALTIRTMANPRSGAMETYPS